MRSIELGKTKEKIPILGQGTWGIKGKKSKEYYDQWKKSLRRGIELGLTHIDTAEAYGGGVSEKIVGEVVKEYNRDELFITSKLFPMHVSSRTMRKAAEDSLARLDLKQFDLYLVHWPNPVVPIQKQMKIMEEVYNKELTRYIGVSNFSVDKFKKAQESLKNVELVTNQLVANITKQKHIHKSLEYYQKNNIILTAYSPLAHRGYTKLEGDLRDKLESLAKAHNATIQQIAIAWLINHENVITIPKAFSVEHMEANAAAADITLTLEELRSLYPTS